MAIAAVTGVPHQNGHFPFTLPIVRHRIEKKGPSCVGKYSSSPRTFGCVLEVDKSPRVANTQPTSLLRQAT